MAAVKWGLIIVAVLVTVSVFYSLIKVRQFYFLDLRQNEGVTPVEWALPGATITFYLTSPMPIKYELPLGASVLQLSVDNEALWPNIEVSAIDPQSGESFLVRIKWDDQCVSRTGDKDGFYHISAQQPPEERAYLWWGLREGCYSISKKLRDRASRIPLNVAVVTEFGDVVDEYSLTCLITKNGYMDAGAVL